MNLPTYGGSRAAAGLRSPATPAASGWVDLGQCATIAATSQPPVSRMIVQLQPYRERIFLGYGEWDVGLDACDLLAWNITTRRFETVAGGIATDAFWSLRVVDDALWALVTDPSVGTDPDAVVVAGDAIRVIASGQVGPWHLFDVGSWAGAVYLAGANRVGNESRAAIWCSSDGGESWEVVLEVADNPRMYGLFSLGGGLYCVGFGGTVWQTNDGDTWSRLTQGLLPVTTEFVHGTTLADEVVYLSGWPAFGPQTLYAFDGQHVRTVAPEWSVRDVFGDGASLVVLTVDGQVKRSEDLVAWEVVATEGPPNARSVCHYDDVLYLGTADSRLWRRALD